MQRENFSERERNNKKVPGGKVSSTEISQIVYNAQKIIFKMNKQQAE